MPVSSSVNAQVAVRVLRDLEPAVRKMVSQDSKGIGQDLVQAIRAAPGVSPYQRVYAKLGATAKVRARPGRPPEVVIGGARRFGGGGTVNSLVRAYEYGSSTGDTRRGPGRPASRAKGGRWQRRKRPLPQFPPKSNEGLWVNAVCERYESGPLIEQWLTLFDDALGRVARG